MSKVVQNRDDVIAMIWKLSKILALFCVSLVSDLARQSVVVSQKQTNGFRDEANSQYFFATDTSGAAIH